MAWADDGVIIRDNITSFESKIIQMALTVFFPVTEVEEPIETTIAIPWFYHIRLLQNLTVCAQEDQHSRQCGKHICEGFVEAF